MTNSRAAQRYISRVLDVVSPPSSPAQNNMKLTLSLLTSVALMASASAIPLEARDNHVDWYQDPRGDVAKLFLREGDKPGKPLAQGPAFGSAGTFVRSWWDFRLPDCLEWKALYPPTDKIPSTNTIPSSWLARLSAARATNAYPKNVPITTADASGNYVYPAGSNPSAEPICSFPNGCNKATDFYDAPDGILAVSPAACLAVVMLMGDAVVIR